MTVKRIPSWLKVAGLAVMIGVLSIATADADTPSSLATFRVIQIVPPAGYIGCEPIAVNDNGTVIGNVYTDRISTDKARSSFIYSDGKMTVLPDLWLFALNNHDKALARADSTSQAATVTVDSSGKVTALPNCPQMWPKVITDSGIVAGDCTGAQTPDQPAVLPFTYKDGKVQWYALTPGDNGGEVRAVDSSGTAIYGNAWGNGVAEQAVCWSNSSVSVLPTPILPSPEVVLDSGVLGMDGKGEVLCNMTYARANGTHVHSAYLLRGSQAIPIDLYDSRGMYSNILPAAISADGDMVGTANTSAMVIRNGEMLDLNTLIDSTSGWTLLAATAISSKGNIVGTGTFNGQPAAYLLIPVH